MNEETKMLNDKLPVPLVCECGFATMSARKAIEHLEKYHPEETECVKCKEIDNEPD